MASPASVIPRGSRFSDYLTNLHFYMMDVSFKTPVVFNVSYGFRYIQAPELTVNTKEVKDGTNAYHKFVFQSATVGSITLHQGVQIFNSDFYDWIKSSVDGTQSYRRNFVMLQFTDIAPFSVGDNGTGPLGGVGGVILNSVMPLNDLLARVPGRAWMLKGCIPTHYKAATDFDALSADVSIIELTIQPEEFSEFSVGI